MKEESRGKPGNLTRYLKIEVFATPHIHLCAFSLCPMPCQEVMEISLRSRRSQRKVRENGDKKELATLCNLCIAASFLSLLAITFLSMP